ncbi:sucrose-6F-phosphate phosphohydrolase [Sulfobacillus acidophilus DSM 10332]|uniref:Sucrose-6F-phosphate phosphohydrolase n=1 Tax=Sulfobacillus acidophilus (strain ATCC 700253 / DSM 10332 / NAL) TaxID=679936 RepID=G8TVG8_SULAD|nr:sucrose-6F-phosphate phosphohydrolase [Sulfobacillus acidophilus DSM 10332]
MASIKRVLATDIDGTLIGYGGERELAEFLHSTPELGIIYLTGRTKANAEAMLRQYGFPAPVAMATDIGADIYWGPQYRLDDQWAFAQRRDWAPRRVQAVLAGVPGVTFLGRSSHWRLAYHVDGERVLSQVQTRLVEGGVVARTLWHDAENRLDVIPRGAFKGRALKHILDRLALKAHQCFVAGDADNDIDILEGRYLGVLVANSVPRLRSRAAEQIWRSPYPGALGVLDALKRWLAEQPELLTSKAVTL